MHGFRLRYGHFSGNPQALREQAIKHIPPAIRDALNTVGWSPDEVDLVCSHQVTVDLINTVTKACNLDPEKCVVTVTDCGNIAAASVPVGLSTAFERGQLARGSKVLLVGAAAGFSVGVVPLVW